MHVIDTARDLSSELYDQYFTVVPANNPQLVDAAYVLRHQVYCAEHGYFAPVPDGREVDRYDAHSVHAVLISRSSGSVVGCVRLVLPQQGTGVAGFPIYELLNAESRTRLEQCNPGVTAEISRYAVSKTLRRREGEEQYPDVAQDLEAFPDVRRLAPHLSVGLLRGVAMLAAEQGITTLCAAMAPALLRLLKRFGLQFEPLGEPIEYHGLRQPCLSDCESLLAGIAQRRSDYYTLVDAAYRGSQHRTGRTS